MKLHLFKFNGIHIVFPFIVYILSFGIKSSITIFPFVFYRNQYIRKNQLTRIHKTIHIRQQMECGLAGIFLMFLILFIDKFDFSLIFNSTWFFIILPAIFLYIEIYILSYFINTIKYWNDCRFHRKVCFEKEAHYHCNINTYLDIRKSFAWIKYL
jgi:hypothetical protein